MSTPPTTLPVTNQQAVQSQPINALSSTELAELEAYGDISFAFVGARRHSSCSSTEPTSLDCGLPANEPSPYSEPNTGLHFSSDAEFIQSGESGTVKTNLENLLKPYTTLRYFPEGTRNCYTLLVEKGRKYLIKAWFRYGNYDGQDIKPMFDLYLGPNQWATVDMKDVETTSEEILHVPTSDSLQICLVKNGITTPFISSLELRPLRNDSYITQSGSLKLISRIYYTKSENYRRKKYSILDKYKESETRDVYDFDIVQFDEISSVQANENVDNNIIFLLTNIVPTLRYPDDVFDRLWDSRSLSWLTHISTTSDVSDGQSYNLPKAVRESAATRTNASLPLTISWTPENPSDQFYMYLHFAEIQDLQANETREFAVFLDGNRFADPVIPKKFEITTIASQIPLTCEGEECNLQLTRTRRSTLPPLLNAYEIYKVMQFAQPETDETEVVALKSIQDTYKLIRINWQGDPCVPQHLMWDGLTCSISPRVTSLNLSSIGLTGTIAAAIQNLTQLEELDLSNNKLTGELPEFLGNIKPLLFINLSGNDLNGSIPQSLQNKGIELLLHGNPRLCQTKSCTKPHSKDFPVVIVATAASVIILVAVLVLVFRKKNQYTAMQAQQMPPSMPAVVNTNSHEPLNEIKRRMFTYSEVIKMTNNFQNSLGKGGFGMVYHGFVNGSKQVAVKVLSQSSIQGYKEFKAEVDLLLRVHHTNLVTLVGYCYEGDHLALIYEFLPNGDLKQHLTGKGGRPIINWSTRLGIALEAALGLEYLHIGCTPPMVHRDVKTANILLDDNFKAKLADFGLSRSFQGGIESRDFTAIAGTPGYLDPEYNHLGRLGFISLDCGLPSNESPYKESSSGLWFSSDENFTQGGKTGRVRETPERFAEQFNTLRYFPDGIRNCYNLNVEKGRRYLVRATFVYGNYDGLGMKPVFDIHLGPNLWATIDLQKVNGTVKDMLHIAASSSMQICLVKTGVTEPLISSLELRPMRNESYITESGSLDRYFRYYLSESSSQIRYSSDIYDRLWDPLFLKEWTQLSTANNVGNNNSYRPPEMALKTAATPTNSSIVIWEEMLVKRHLANSNAIHLTLC
ncbi:hypothetical protein F2Q70_00007790 [Brassica cretica]|uniref:non-specific serine/threonine protein kinase n=1 Tax=Brassica cretica TaxID=69181 RepID=A0A8S9M5H0_BRACR|nr:hypothetical protein F2Q70_00007790 [Brassica cretica]